MIFNVKYFKLKKYLSVLCIAIFSNYCVSAQLAVSNDINVKFLIDAKGTCNFEGGSLSLNNVYFLKDKSLIESTIDGYRILEVNKDDFNIAYYSKNGKFKQLKFDNVSMKVSLSNKNNSDVDIEASFILIEGQVAVYWKETFINRMYKQGIFKIDADKLVFFCEGKGGTYTSH